MNYALVSGAVVDLDVGEATTITTTHSISNDRTTRSQQRLTAIYNYYASQQQQQQQPHNPRLVQEEEERRMLLKQVLTAKKSRQLMQQQQQQQDGNTRSLQQLPPRNQQQDKTTATDGREERGWFGSLFRRRYNNNKRRRRRRQNHNEQDDDEQDDEQDEELLKLLQDDDKYLEYYYDDENDDENEDSMMTTSSISLDVTCIPQDAMGECRFQLSCQPPNNVPNVARSYGTTSVRGGGDRNNNNNVVGMTVTLVHVGTICEIYPNGSSAIVETNDLPILRDYIQQQQQQRRHQNENENDDYCTSGRCEYYHYDIGRARAIVLLSSDDDDDNNLLAISWGLPNDGGIVILYRRHQQRGTNCTWNAIAFLSPTRPVRDDIVKMKMTTTFHDTNERRRRRRGNDDDNVENQLVHTSSLLHVTDIVVLTVKDPHNNDDDDVSTVTTTILVISRLGGYIEFIVLPHHLWTLPQHASSSSRTKKKRRRSSNSSVTTSLLEYYSTTTQQQQLYNVVMDLEQDDTNNTMTALTTSEFHTDVMCMEVLRTNVCESTVWDTNVLPHNTPPAEYVLAATGGGHTLSKNNTHEQHHQDQDQVVSFWSVAIVFDNDQEETNDVTMSTTTTGRRRRRNHGPKVKYDNSNVSVHVTSLHSINIGTVGPNVSIFATDIMVNKWRMPRRVRLRRSTIALLTMNNDDDANNDDDDMTMLLSTENEENDDHQDDATTNHEGCGVTSSSSSSVRVDSNPMTTKKKRTVSSLGTVVSTPMPVVTMRFVSGDDSQHKQVFLAALDGNGGVTVIDCTIVVGLASHDISHNVLDDDVPVLRTACKLPSTSLSPTVDIGWLSRDLVDDDKNDGGCCFALVAMKPRMLQVVNLELSSPRLDGRDTIARVSCSLDLPSLPQGATIIRSTPSQNISFVAFKTSKDGRRLLCQGNLERLDSTTVLAMLVKGGKYTEAIDYARTMNVPTSCSDTIQFCHKKLWERQGDIVHLSAVTDDGYVVKEALSIFNDDSDSRENVDLGTARSACLLALERMTSGRFASSPREEKEEDDEKFRQLEAIEAKVSTYILLCMHGDAVPQLPHFREKFLSTSMRQLASAFASRGDTTALTTILFRHRPELLPYQLEILDELPLEIPPDKYPHLLPVLRCEKSFFHTGEHGDDGLRHWSLMAHYMESTNGVRLLLDDKDEAVVLDRCRQFDDLRNVLRVNSIREWFVTRAERIQSEIGSVSFLRAFLELASQRLGTSLEGEGGEPELCELRSMYHYTLQLNRLVADDSCIAASGKLVTDALTTMTVSDIEKMSLEDRLVLVLGPPSDPSTAISKLRNGSVFLAIGEEDGNEQHQHAIDNSIAAYCRNAISSSVDNIVKRDLPQAMALRNALDICTEIANASRSTIQRSHRVIKDKSVLMNLVVDNAYNTSRACKLIELSPTDCCHLVDSIWESYESLPIRVTPEQTSQNAIETKVDSLYRNYVVVDILSRWSSAALRFLIDLDNAGRERASVGLTAVNEMCGSFCHQLRRFKAAAAVDLELNLLADLTSDIDQLNNVGFGGTLQMVTQLEESLIKPLLQQEKFHVVDALADWINRDRVQQTVLAFVKEAMFDSDEYLLSSNGIVDGDRVHAAIKCQDALGPSFPELRVEFESSRRYLDAAFFINRMIAGSSGFTSPSEVREKLPLDVIESVMANHPGCILDGCKDWMDRAFAKKANETIRGHYWSKRPGNVTNSPVTNGAALPILPGSSIYRIGSLLGLEGPYALLVLKARVVYHAILASQSAAAAALCATMVYENGASWDDAAVARCIVDAVARVVSLNEYDDAEMKLALCRAVFERDRGNLSSLDYPAYEAVLDAFVSLEDMTRRHQRPQQTAIGSLEPNATNEKEGAVETPAAPDFLVFRAAGLVAKTAKNVARHAQQPHQHQQMPHGFEFPDTVICRQPSLSDRVYLDIVAQYSTDIRHLFLILRGVAASNSVDDPLLLTLGRLIGFWCISDALRMRPQNVSPEPDRDDLEEVLALGMSLLLHVQDRAGLASCVGELQGVFGRETVAAMERAAFAAQPDNVLPDPEIVQTLISRGYSENGARRAAVMTSNESAQVALVWAVSHTLDDGFDDPIVVVASPDGFPSSRRIDQSMVHCLQEALNSANAYISQKSDLKSLLPTRDSSTTTTTLMGVPTPHNGRVFQQNDTGERMDEVVGETKVPYGLSLRSEPIDRLVAKASPTTPAVADANDGKGADNAESSSATRLLAVEKPVRLPQPISPTTTSRTLVTEGGLATSSSVASHKDASRPSARLKTKSPVPPTEPPPSSKQAGQRPPAKSRVPAPKASSASSQVAADRLSTLTSADKTTKSGAEDLAVDERQRLIEEGRRMLQQARASRKSAASKIIPPRAGDSSTSKHAVASSQTAATRRHAVRSTQMRNTDGHATESNGTKADPRIPTGPADPVAPSSEGAKKQQDSDNDGWDFDDF